MNTYTKEILKILKRHYNNVSRKATPKSVKTLMNSTLLTKNQIEEWFKIRRDDDAAKRVVEKEKRVQIVEMMEQRQNAYIQQRWDESKKETILDMLIVADPIRRDDYLNAYPEFKEKFEEKIAENKRIVEYKIASDKRRAEEIERVNALEKIVQENIQKKANDAKKFKIQVEKVNSFKTKTATISKKRSEKIEVTLEIDLDDIAAAAKILVTLKLKK